MAKAWNVAGLDGQETYRRSAGRVLAVRAEELFSFREGVDDVAQIERLHGMRVASRRLRAAMEIFAPCFPTKPYRRALGEVKALADALGERRDRDVQIERLRRLIEELTPPERPGIESLVERLQIEQAEANQALRQQLRSAEQGGLEERLRELAGLARAESELVEAEQRLRLVERMQSANQDGAG